MTAFVVTDAEREKLVGIPHLAFRLYIVLRSLMNFTTGRVGDKPRISWHALTERLYVEPHPGIAGGSPSAQQVRRAAWHLERRGLVRFRSSEVHRILVFFLPHAQRGFFDPEKADSKPTDKADRPRTEGNGTDSRQTSTEQSRHTSESLRDLRSSQLTTTTTSTPWHQGIVWPSTLSTEEKATMARLLEQRVPDPRAARVLVDELRGAIGKGAVRNAPAYLRGLVQRFERGTFVPELANDPGVQAQRELDQVTNEMKGRK